MTVLPKPEILLARTAHEMALHQLMLPITNLIRAAALKGEFSARVTIAVDEALPRKLDWLKRRGYSVTTPPGLTDSDITSGVFGISWANVAPNSSDPYPPVSP